MNELEELYYNAGSYAERLGYNTSAEWTELLSQREKLLQALSAAMDNTQKKNLQQLHDLYIEQTKIEMDRMFFFAFASGA